MTLTLISTVTVGAGGAASIAFNSIAGTATDLYILLSARVNVGGTARTLGIKINGQTSTYADRWLRGSGSAADSGSFGNIFGYGALPSAINDSGATSNTFSSTSIYIPNYASSGNKSISTDTVTENNATQAYQVINAGSWASGAITSVELLTDSPFLQYSTASLYTITKGSGGASVS